MYMQIRAMCVHTVKCIQCTEAQTQRLEAATVPCTYCTEETAFMNCDLLTKNVYFSTQECGCYIFLSWKLYFNTQGLRVTEFLFRGFWLMTAV